MQAQVKEVPPDPAAALANIRAARQHSLNVTLTGHPSSDTERVMRTLSEMKGVIRVEPRAPAPTPDVPREMQAFATRLWEVL